MRLVFPSLAKPSETAYTWLEHAFDSPWRYERNRDCLCDAAGWFQTYGDGMVQHSPDRPVVRTDALDYLASMVAHLYDSHDEETLACVAQHWPHPECHIGRSAVVFALGLRYVEGKRRYYTISDGYKVSSSDSKRHDKRWTEVPEYADGSVVAALRLVNRSYASPLETYSLAYFIDQTTRELGGCSLSWPDLARATGFIPDDSDYNDGSRQYGCNLHSAFYCVNEYVGAWRMMDGAKRNWSCLENNYCRNVLGIGVDEPETAAA